MLKKETRAATQELKNTPCTQYVAAEPTFLRGAASAFDLDGSLAQFNVYPLRDAPRHVDVWTIRRDKLKVRQDRATAHTKRVARQRPTSLGLLKSS